MRFFPIHKCLNLGDVATFYWKLIRCTTLKVNYLANIFLDGEEHMFVESSVIFSVDFSPPLIKYIFCCFQKTFITYNKLISKMLKIFTLRTIVVVTSRLSINAILISTFLLLLNFPFFLFSFYGCDLSLVHQLPHFI